MLHNSPFCKKEIHFNQEYERKEWCKLFHCTEKDLKKAIRSVGSNLVAVSLYLQKNHRSLPSVQQAGVS